MPASTEFVALCRSQLTLIASGLGAVSCAVYLAEEFADVSRRHLIPVAFYPEPNYPQADYHSPPALEMSAKPSHASHGTHGSRPVSLTEPGTPPFPATTSPNQLTPINPSPAPQEGLVVPLIHNDLVLGLLVARRSERDWTTEERQQLTEISQTLALACVLDQRHQWLLQSGYQQRSFLTRQYDTLANLLHQIRNPLTTVRTLAKLMFKRQPAGTKEQELIAGILQESEHLQQLLQQFDQTIDVGEAILEQGGLDQGGRDGFSPEPTPAPVPTTPLALPAGQSPVGSTLHLQPLNLAELLHPLLVAHQSLADERHQTLTTSIPVVPSTAAPLPEVMADPQALREVVGNLLDNALKCTPAGGQIHVSLCRHTETPDHNQQVICVSDTGPGIPNSDLPNLFQRHYRGIQAAGAIPGTGLGLAIARELMQQMQGSLEVVSPALWQPDPPNGSNDFPGSTFILKLPEVVTKPTRSKPSGRKHADPHFDPA